MRSSSGVGHCAKKGIGVDDPAGMRAPDRQRRQNDDAGGGGCAGHGRQACPSRRASRGSARRSQSSRARARVERGRRKRDTAERAAADHRRRSDRVGSLLGLRDHKIGREREGDDGQRGFQHEMDESGEREIDAVDAVQAGEEQPFPNRRANRRRRSPATASAAGAPGHRRRRTRCRRTGRPATDWARLKSPAKARPARRSGRDRRAPDHATRRRTSPRCRRRPSNRRRGPDR